MSIKFVLEFIENSLLNIPDLMVSVLKTMISLFCLQKYTQLPLFNFNPSRACDEVELFNVTSITIRNPAPQLLSAASSTAAACDM